MVAAPLMGVSGVKKFQQFCGALGLCLAGTVNAHSFTVGGMEIRYEYDAAPIAVAQLFQEWRAEQRAAYDTHVVLVREEGRSMLRVARSARSVPSLVARQ